MQIKTKIISLLFIFITTFLCTNVYAQDYSIWINRCEPYRNEVEKILDNEQVSRDFYYLMIAESKCRINAKSNKGAQGFWQLMPATSRYYGCHNPHDVQCATLAAAKYIKQLSLRFNSFDEVIAAYNMGGHNYKKYGKTQEAIGLIKRVRTIKQQDSNE